MNALDRTRAKISWGHAGLHACMASSCLMFGGGLFFFVPVMPILGLSLPFAAATASFGALTYTAYRLKKHYMKNLPRYAADEAEDLRPVPEGDEAHEIYRALAAKEGFRAPPLLYANPGHATGILNRTLGGELVALDEKLLAQASPAEKRYVLAHALARQKYIEREEHALYTHAVTQMFNISARVFYVGMVAGILALNTTLSTVFNSQSPVTIQTLNDHLGTYPSYMMAGIFGSALAAFMIRGSIVRNVTLACDLEAVKACGGTAGGRSIIARQEKDFPQVPENFVAEDITMVADFFSRKTRKRIVAILKPGPEHWVSRFVTGALSPVNRFLAVGQDRVPVASRRLKLIEKFARQAGLGDGPAEIAAQPAEAVLKPEIARLPEPEAIPVPASQGQEFRP